MKSLVYFVLKLELAANVRIQDVHGWRENGEAVTYVTPINNIIFLICFMSL